MSGGSFNYVCYAASDAAEIFGKLSDVQGIEEWLRANSKHDAADEVLLYLKELQTHQRRIETLGKRMGDLLQSAEWTASGDTGMDRVDNAYKSLMGLSNPMPPSPSE